MISVLTLFTANDVKLQIARQKNKSSSGGPHSPAMIYSTDIYDTSFPSSVQWTN